MASRKIFRYFLQGAFFRIVYKLKAEIALAEAAPAISAFRKTQLTCKLILK